MIKRENVPTNHAVDGAKEHGTLGWCGAFPEVLQHQRAMAKDIYKLAKVKDPNLLQVLSLLISGGRTDRGKGGGRDAEEKQKKESTWQTEKQCGVAK